MYRAFARSSHFLRHLVTPYTFWFLCPSFFASSSNIFAPAALLASSSNFGITCMYYVLSSAHCPPPSPSSAFPVTTIYIYVGMHIYCNAVSHNYSHNFVHWLISGSSADNSKVHCCITTQISSSSVAVCQAQNYDSIHRSQVPLTFLGWDFMPIYVLLGGQAWHYPSPQLHLGLPMRNGSMA